MDLTVKHTIDPIKLDVTGFEAVLDKLSAQMETMVSSLTQVQSKADDNRINLDQKTEPNGYQIPNAANYSNTGFNGANPNMNYNVGGNPGETTSRNAQMMSLLNKLDSLISKLNENQNNGGGVTPPGKPPADPLKKEDSSWSKYARGMLLGAGVTAAWQAGNFGATSGHAAGAMNTGATDYLQFQRNLYNEQQNNQEGIAASGIIAMGALGTQLSTKLPGAWKLAGIAATTALSAYGMYKVNQSGETNKADTELAYNADYENWRLQQYGVSGKSNMTINAKGNIVGLGKTGFAISELQKELYTGPNKAFSQMTPSLLFDARRDQMPWGNNKALDQYGSDIQKSAMLMGVNPQELNKVVSNYAAFTGSTLDASMKELIKVNKEYGGNTVANTGKMLEIMTSTPLSAGVASDLANKYQYNDAMLQNKLAESTTSPMNKFQKNLYMKLAGASSEEIANGEFSGKHLQDYHNAQKSMNSGTLTNPKWLFMEMAYAAGGQSLMANDIGGVRSTTMGSNTGAPGLPAEFSGFADNVVNALKNITTINVTSATINTSSTPMPVQTHNAPLPDNRMGKSLAHSAKWYMSNPEDDTKMKVHPGQQMEQLRKELSTGVGESDRGRVTKVYR